MNSKLCICGKAVARRGMCWKHYRRKLKREKFFAALADKAYANKDLILSIVNKVEAMPWIGITQKTPEQAGFFRGIEAQITTGG